MRRSIAITIALLTTLAFIGRPAALVPDLIPVQGVLTDLDGNAIDGAANARFALYDAEVGGTELWVEVYSGENQLFFDQGFFTVYLGTLNSLFFEDLLHAEELWLGVTVGLDEEMDRVRLAAVPFAQQCRLIGEFEADDLQPRVYIEGEDDGMCPAGQIIRGIDPETGAITCVDDMTTSSDDGTIVGVSGISPITTETTDGNVQVSLNRTVTDGWYAASGHDHDALYAAIGHDHAGDYMPAVTCATAGHALKWNGSAWACAADENTTYSAGTGLTETGTVFAADMGHLQRRLNISSDYDNGMCPSGQIIRGINPATGAITCVVDQTEGTGGGGEIVAVTGIPPVHTDEDDGFVDVWVAVGTGAGQVAAGDHTHDGEYWNLGGNAGATAGQYIGTSDNVALNFRVNDQRALRIEPHATSPIIIGGHADNSVVEGVYGAVIGGGRGNHITYNYSTIGGGRNNTAHEDSTVGGGGENTASNHYSTVGGGYNNTASEHLAAVGAGGHNTAGGEASTVAGGMQNTAGSFASTVAGGLNNIAGGSRATVGGGDGNRAMCEYATIGGGQGNEVQYENWAPYCSSHATIGGGKNNTIMVPSDYSAIFGGENNSVAGSHAFIGGGQNNQLGCSNNDWSAIVGGRGNSFDNARYGIIGGGYFNEIFGVSYAAIPGGFRNVVNGDYAFAAGRQARAMADGCFVWGDSTDANVVCDDDNAWVARASGGVTFYTNSAMTLGAQLNSNATAWSVISDREMKKDIEIVDAVEVLEKVAAMPVSTWRYNTPESTALHMGPMAQDFHAAFGLGDSDKAISTIDADGVALAAIQGLNEKLEEENADLRERIDRLEKRLDRIDGGGRSPLALASPLLLLGLLGLGGVVLARSRR